MLVLPQNKVLSPGDLGINVRNDRGMLVDPAMITYSIFAVGENDVRSLISSPNMVPARYTTGVYFVSLTIPAMWSGQCSLVWYIQLQPGVQTDQLHEEFEVAAFDPLKSSFEAPSMLLTSKPGLSKRVIDMVVTVRELVQDTNPDRNYHFRPPTPGKVVAGFTSRVGFIWQDSTIIRLLKLTVAQLNSWNPMTLHYYTIENLPQNWGEAAALGAAAKCLSAEGSRQLADQFDYSLNGISLSLNKAGEYMSLASAYQQEFEVWAPLISAVRPAVLGLRQNLYLT